MKLLWGDLKIQYLAGTESEFFLKSRNRIRICAKFFYFIYMRANLILYVYAVAADAALKRHKPATASASHHRTAEIG